MRTLLITALLALGASLESVNGAGDGDRFIDITLKDAEGKNTLSHIMVGGVYPDGTTAFTATSRCSPGVPNTCLLHKDFRGRFQDLPKGETKLLLQLRPGRLAVWRPENPVSVAKVPAPEGSNIVIISGTSQLVQFTKGGEPAMDPEEPSTPPPVEPNL
ncbi:uncharacterized protein LOC113212964 isoform X2 [Frankliniella occidentalis]|uniref:Uncharacterized protein LOC113212964 isoform X2 n=1 Tax=Frankliniella occidentalis TaxID=133901 RepID=A0A9C6XSH9_FRAOC|nr:uncharacterized protein LOC113212964 isoform X2 [Frankliniella occidentalis]XP_052129644.1 uncharacterized protein LOC113212964 isoform X2 [Frankliniella occidentalis]